MTHHVPMNVMKRTRSTGRSTERDEGTGPARGRRKPECYPPGQGQDALWGLLRRIAGRRGEGWHSSR